VTVSADMAGVNYGNGVWGQSDVVRHFSIRPDGIIMKADAQSHRLIVTSQSGLVLKNFPVSYGLNDVQQRNTVSGIHIVQEKWPTKVMCNTAFGYCGVSEKWAVRINNNGEFIHENDKVLADLGVQNVSHGCINMGPGDAQTFYNMAMYGDPVEVTNTGAKMTAADYVYDWIYSATDWKTLSALS
jgi:lipoprotein-anchoring transpeptidase ErfK/SrfK